MLLVPFTAGSVPTTNGQIYMKLWVFAVPSGWLLMVLATSLTLFLFLIKAPETMTVASGE